MIRPQCAASSACLDGTYGLLDWRARLAGRQSWRNGGRRRKPSLSKEAPAFPAWANAKAFIFRSGCHSLEIAIANALRSTKVMTAFDTWAVTQV